MSRDVEEGATLAGLLIDKGKISEDENGSLRALSVRVNTAEVESVASIVSVSSRAISISSTTEKSVSASSASERGAIVTAGERSVPEVTPVSAFGSAGGVSGPLRDKT
jgi:hypothetical protein